MAESYLGIDVGYSEARPTTGLCLLTLNQNRLTWACRNTGSEERERVRDLRELVPRGTHLSAVGIDGPLARGLVRVNHYRAADALLTRGTFQRRCKPGPTNSPTGRQLHAHATQLANIVVNLRGEGHLQLENAPHPHHIHTSRIVEVFPDAFLGVLLQDADFEPIILGRGKSDRFWERAVGHYLLENLVQHLAPQTEFGQPLNSIEDHDHRAAFICALASMCVSRNEYVSVGDPEHGHIILPPCGVWPLEANTQISWTQAALQGNIGLVRNNAGHRPNHGAAFVICNGRIWL